MHESENSLPPEQPVADEAFMHPLSSANSESLEDIPELADTLGMLSPALPPSTPGGRAASDDGEEAILVTPASPPGPTQTGLVPVDMSEFGRVEVLSTDFVVGWSTLSASGNYACVYAMLDGEVLGYALADLSRADLEAARAAGTVNARAFVVLYQSSIPHDRARDVQVFVLGVSGHLAHFAPGSVASLPQSMGVRLDRCPPLQLFILGSPRSGTSQLGSSLVQAFSLPWAGEGHVAPCFKAAADALVGDPRAVTEFPRFLAEQNLREIAVSSARRAYFHMHSSASFVDKTPGIDMVRAAPFVQECFPQARFVFLHRHPVANILSRVARFGGSFEEHCAEWAATMQAWMDVKAVLGRHIEVEQIRMLREPVAVGRDLAVFADQPDAAHLLATMLSSDRLEYTGAGSEVDRLEDTGWSDEQKSTFSAVCQPAARAFGYEL